MKKIIYFLLLITSFTTYAQCYSEISSKTLHNLSIKPDGTLWAWGSNSNGQVGNNSINNQPASVPIQIGTDTNWQSVSAGSFHSLAIKNDGTLWAWGSNQFGQTGNGGPNTPQIVGSDSDWAIASAGQGFSAAIKSNGTLWMWGSNAYGQLGNGTTINSSIPLQVGSDNNWVAVATGSQYTLALKADGTLWAWGLNESGELGDGTFTDKLVPVQIGNQTNWAQITVGYSNSYAIKFNGTLWAWGNNLFGSVGNGSSANVNSPVQIGTDTWKSIAGTYHCLAIKTDGTLWSWGRNGDGEVGNGNPGVNQSTPVQVGADTDWIKTAAGFYHSIALRGNGILWSWGDNDFGTLGNGTFTNNLIPTQVGSVCNQVLCTIAAPELTAVTSTCSVGMSDITSPVITDSCGNSITGTVYIGAFPVTTQGTTTIVWKFANASGFVTAQQDIIIDDTTAPQPEITDLPQITAQCQINTTDITAPQAMDNCTGTIDATTDTTFPIIQQGITLITWTYTDSAGNTTTQTQEAVINDITAPEMTTQNITIDLAGQPSVTITAEDIDNGSADNCGPVTLSLNTTTFTATGVYPVLLTVTDTTGNQSIGQATVTVNDSSLSTNAFGSNKNAIKIYPVPAKDWLYIDNPTGITILKTEVYDITGRLIISNSKSTDKIDVSGLDSARYYIYIVSDNETHRYNFIKQ